MNLRHDFKMVKHVLMEENLDEGSLKPEYFYVNFPSKIFIRFGTSCFSISLHTVRFLSIFNYHKHTQTHTLTKRLEKKLDGKYTRRLRAILNKSWQQHPTRRQLYSHLPPITKTIQAR